MIYVRPVEIDDVSECLEIYNYYVENSDYTFEERALTLPEFENRVAALIEKFPFFVALDNDTVIGYAYLDRFSNRSAYRYTAELSIYLHKNRLNREIGGKLLYAVEQNGLICGIKNVVSVTSSTNEASVRFLQKNGYNFCGELPDVGYKFEKNISIKYFIKNLV